jgi:ATP-dependent DNA ligase
MPPHGLRVERHGDRVKLTSRGGLDWTRRFPWIAETARKIRKTHGVGPMRQVSQDRAAAFSFSATSPALRLKRANSGSAT